MAPKIFISYRRDEAADAAGRAYDAIAELLSEENVFIDVENIHAGARFPDKINSALQRVRCMMVVCGPHWADPNFVHGQRLYDERDWVRQEVQYALRNGIHIVPLLVNGAKMPSSEFLPDALAGFTNWNGRSVSHDRFREDIHRILVELEFADSASVSKAQEQRKISPSRFAKLREDAAKVSMDATNVAVGAAIGFAAAKLSTSEPRPSTSAAQREPIGYWLHEVISATRMAELEELFRTFLEKQHHRDFDREPVRPIACCLMGWDGQAIGWMSRRGGFNDPHALSIFDGEIANFIVMLRKSKLLTSIRRQEDKSDSAEPSRWMGMRFDRRRWRLDRWRWQRGWLWHHRRFDEGLILCADTPFANFEVWLVGRHVPLGFLFVLRPHLRIVRKRWWWARGYYRDGAGELNHQIEDIFWSGHEEHKRSRK